MGDLFYSNDHQDNCVYELLDLVIIQGNKDWYKYIRKKHKRNDIQTIIVQGINCLERPIIRFQRRDKSSFIAGFRACIQLYHNHVNDWDKQNAGLDNDLKCHIKMHEKYNLWKYNQ